MQSDEKFFRSPAADEFFGKLNDALLQAKRPANEIFMDDAELCSYLKISKRHAANLRAKRLIPYYKSGGKLLYRLSEVIAFVETNKIEAIPETKKIKSNFK